MILYGIDTKDISVVVQGAIDPKNTRLCLRSIRKYLPEAEIILSTWEGTEISSFDFDVEILNKDPGGVKDINTSFVNNLNRQIISSKNGIIKSNRKYCLKIRNDLVLKSNKFLKYINKYPIRNENFSFFEARVIFCSIFFKKYLGTIANDVTPVPFHISDWLMFGLQSDLLKLFDINLAQEPENTNYLIDNEIFTVRPNLFGASHQYAPEQYILYNSIKQNNNNFITSNFKHILAYNSEHLDFYEKFVANNCIILDPYQFSIYCSKKDGVDPYFTWTTNYLSLPYYIFEGLYRHDVFLEDYIIHCDKSYKIPRYVIARNKLYFTFNKFFEKRR